MRRTTTQITVSAVALVALTGSAQIWAPQFDDTQWTIPFTPGLDRTVRYQEVFSASAFSAIPFGGSITGLAFRLSCQQGELCQVLTQPTLQISFSTTTKAPDSLSSTFSDNVGADVTTVFGPGDATFSGTPQITLPLMHPFAYDPRRGNLLMDIRVTRGISTPAVRAASGSGDAASSVYAIGPTGADSASGTIDTLGLYTGFLVTPVPEPSTIWLLGAGLFGISVRVFRS